MERTCVPRACPYVSRLLLGCRRKACSQPRERVQSAKQCSSGATSAKDFARSARTLDGVIPKLRRKSLLKCAPQLKPLLSAIVRTLIRQEEWRDRQSIYAAAWFGSTP